MRANFIPVGLRKRIKILHPYVITPGRASLAEAIGGSQKTHQRRSESGGQFPDNRLQRAAYASRDFRNDGMGHALPRGLLYGWLALGRIYMLGMKHANLLRQTRKTSSVAPTW